MEEYIKSEGLQQFVTELHDKEYPNEVVFENAVEALETAKLSLLLEALPIEERILRWQQVPAEIKPSVLVEMRSQAREPILSAMEEEEIEQFLQALDAESLIELADQLSEEWIERALGYLDSKQKQWFESANQYEASQIGRFVDHKILTLAANAKVKDAVRAIKRGKQNTLDHIYLLDRNNVFRGTVKVKDILCEKSELRMVRGLIDTSIPTVSAASPLMESIDELEHAEVKNLPVIDDTGRLIGRITHPTALWVLREHYEGLLMAKAGMAESEDLFVPVMKGARNRAIWLGINLLTAFLASWTIGLFENVLSQVVALAVLMPVVASMGGIAGSQTLALIIRGLAMGQVTLGNALALCKQELGISMINGVGWAIVIGVVSFYWFNNVELSFVIAFAVFANIQAAAVSGVYLPLLLTRFGIDPALSGAVLLTTVTDVFGFVTFLGLGTLLLI
ncbi:MULTISPECIES: magnesium transporter [unclassified Neptuniibacter]|uniref:magnesium transporter n=1 Tax=unclassified Neptuniibacter TaxID=2630693 RepID=UPI0025EC0C7D|nr:MULTISPECIES: magnesium transporter [unclassified Neptuniibacter]|tara:strand:- start:1847 stop:3199 length:1353 start_codon:yes stop_codon:yes gene_type:complete